MERPWRNAVQLFLLFFCLIVASGEKCTKLLTALANKQQSFVRCSTENAVPVRLCISCEEAYTNMKLAYEALSAEKNCTDKYFDKDRVNIVATVQSLLTGLWERTYCDDCYNGNHSGVFDQKAATLEGCLNLHKGHECGNCAWAYADLNSFYIQIDQNNNGNVCYDLQDSMNRTRLEWSKELHCCQREFKMTYFSLASALVGLLTALFYGGVYALTKYQEQNHDLLTMDPEPPAAVAAVTRSIATRLAPVQVPPHSARSPAPSPKKITSAEDSNDSGEDDEDARILDTKR